MNTVNPDKIETERLLLTEVNPSTLSALFGSGSDTEIKDFLGLPSYEVLEAEKAKFQQGWSTWNRSFLYFIIKQKQSFTTIGWCGFHTWYLQHARAELGYGLYSEEYKGNGYMSEALSPIIAYGFNKMDLHRIEAFSSPRNEPSIKLLERNGFTYEGLLREHYFKNGVIEDSAAYSILKKEYFLHAG
jgi:ribosomal-protein-alanine N-acetyltransferase